MLIPKSGECGGVRFKYVCWSIYAMAYEYKIFVGEEPEVVHVNTYKELKDEIERVTRQRYED